MSDWEHGLPTNIFRGIVPTATFWDGTIGYAYLDDGGVFTDDTTDANSAAANDVPLMPAVPVLNDAFYFGEGFSTSGPFNSLKINIGTVGVGGTIAWEYYNGTTWTALGVTDATNGFTTTGTNYVKWTEPADWAAVAVNGQSRYWVRARVLTAFAPIPLATQIWLGRYPTSLSNITDGDVTTQATTGIAVESASSDLGEIRFNLGRSATFLFGARIGIYSSAGNSNLYLYSSDDGITYRQYALPVISRTTTTEKQVEPLSVLILKSQYLKLLFTVTAAGTGYVNIYEIIGIEMGL